MHILYLVDFYKPNKWWIENLIEDFSNYFSNKNKVSIVTYKFDKSLPDKEDNGNITIYRISAKNLIFYMFKAYKFAKEILRDVDIIHWNTFYSAFIAAKLWKKFNKKTFIHVHWFFWEYRNNLIPWSWIKKTLKVMKFKFLEKIISSKKPDKFICVSRFVFDVLRFRYWVDFNLLDVVYNWVDYQKFKGLVDNNKISKLKNMFWLNDKFVFSFFWRIEQVKWWDYYLEVISELLKNEFKNEKIKFLFVIFGDFESFLEKMKKLGIITKKDLILEKLKKWQIVNKDNFLLVPWLNPYEVPTWLKLSDVFVFPSYVESFWLIWLEASILNVPIVASNWWAIPEVVFWKVNFFLEWNKKQLKQALIDARKWNFYEKIPDRKLDIKKTLKNIERLYLWN